VTPQAVQFGLLGAGLAYWSIQIGGNGLWLLWPAINFLIIGGAYWTKTPGVFGKKRDGTLPLWSWLLYLPYHALNVFLWTAARLISREPAFNAVGDTLVVSRRLIGREVQGSYANYVELTAEFQEPRAARRLEGYLALPTLDASAPSIATLQVAIQSLRPGLTLVHCAQGHGRAGLFALVLLLANGGIKNVSEGLALLQNARPAIRLNARQLKCAQEFERQLKDRRA
jgi:hypothetical protein